MSDETKKKEIVIQPFTVDRNGVSATFVQKEITRGEKKDTVYPGVVVAESNIDTIITWMGPQAVAGVISSFMKRMAQGWDKAAKEAGEFDLDKFKGLASSFSVIGETMKVLNDRLRELQLELSKVDIAKVMATPEGSPEKKAFIELAQRVQSVSNAIENKRRSKEDEEQEEKNLDPVSAV